MAVGAFKEIINKWKPETVQEVDDQVYCTVAEKCNTQQQIQKHKDDWDKAEKVAHPLCPNHLCVLGFINLFSATVILPSFTYYKKFQCVQKGAYFQDTVHLQYTWNKPKAVCV